MTLAEVGSGRVPSLERVTTGIGSASGAETKKAQLAGYVLTTFLPGSIGIHSQLLSNMGISTLEISKYSVADSPSRRTQILPQYKANFASPTELLRR